MPFSTAAVANSLSNSVIGAAFGPGSKSMIRVLTHRGQSTRTSTGEAIAFSSRQRPSLSATTPCLVVL